MMIFHWPKSRIALHIVFLLWAFGIAFLIFSIGPRQEWIDAVRPFLAAYLVLCFIWLGAISGRPLRQLSGVLAALLPVLIFFVSFAAAYFISIGHLVSVEDIEAILQSYGAETLSFFKTIMFGPKKMVFALLLAAFSAIVCFCAFFGAKGVQRETWRQRLFPIVLLCVATVFISQFKITRLYFETRDKYIGSIEEFHQINTSLPASATSPTPGRSTFQTVKECVFDYTCYHWDDLIYEKGKSYEENLVRLNTLAENIEREAQLNSTQLNSTQLNSTQHK
jgi:glucan phosphoethanolaminetransferase (alkaline phosphatase superfamily)